MTKAVPQIQKYMTTTPITVEKDSSLVEAESLMKKNKIRHLPVMNKSKIDGVLSSTDVSLIKGLNGVDFENLSVKDCYSAKAYKVSSETIITEVLDEMVEKKYGCVLIHDNEHLVGIFTWIDALKATKTLLETRLKK